MVQNTKYFVNNVCNESKFWQKSGIDQLVLLYSDEIQYPIYGYQSSAY